MKKSLFLFASLAAVLASCGGSQKQIFVSVEKPGDTGVAYQFSSKVEYNPGDGSINIEKINHKEEGTKYVADVTYETKLFFVVVESDFERDFSSPKCTFGNSQLNGNTYQVGGDTYYVYETTAPKQDTEFVFTYTWAVK